MKETSDNNYGFSTEAIHAGRDADYSSPPIHMAATSKHYYTRGGNPTIHALEACVARLENGTHAVATACGMSAVTQTLLPLLKSGDHVLCHRSVYDWTDWWLRDELPRFGITTTQVDFRDQAALSAAMTPAPRVVYCEPLSNPGLDMIDLPRVAERAHAAGALMVVDNTFLSPALFRPLDHGADVVIHSLTKFMSGHGDAMGGMAVTKDPTLHELFIRSRNLYGGVLSPFNAFLIMRGIATLTVRMKQHCANALAVAEFLAGHPAVAETRYPGLAGDPGHKTAKALLPHGCGGMVGFAVKGGSPAVTTFRSHLNLCRPWVSLGDTGTLLYCRASEPRKGIPEGFVRLSVGLEDVKDIIVDLDQALTVSRKRLAAS